MKFAHMADVHIGSWRDPKLKDLSTEAFLRAMNICIKEEVDFILIAGDLFHTALPGLDHLKEVVKKCKQVRGKGIPIYFIAGSHDFSPSGKTMLGVLEEAGLGVDVVKGTIADDKLQLHYTVDEKTGVKITGMLGKRGQLDKTYYEQLDYSALEGGEGFRIFMFHTALSELKPAELEHMEANPISLLPKGFDYYAGGHVHVVREASMEGYKNIVYPGPVFPANFGELEKLQQGGFYIYDDGNLKFWPIAVKNVYSVAIDAAGMSPEEAQDEIMKKLSGREFINTIVQLRVEGKLRTGKVTDIAFKSIIKFLEDKGAFYVMKHTAKLTSPEFEEIKVSKDSIEDIEHSVLKEHAGQIKVGFDEVVTAKRLMRTLGAEKNEGEKVHEFQSRVKEDSDRVLEVD